MSLEQFRAFSIIYIFAYELIVRFCTKVMPGMRNNLDEDEFARIFSSKRIFLFFYIFVLFTILLSILPIVGFLYLARWSPIAALVACALYLVYKAIQAYEEDLSLKPGYIVDYVMVNIPLFILCFEMTKN